MINLELLDLSHVPSPTIPNRLVRVFGSGLIGVKSAWCKEVSSAG
jgi:hypothetical protein